MTQPCIVAQCKNKGYHLLPSDETRRAQWLQAIVHIKPELSIRKYSRICRAHFKKSDFNTTALSLLNSDVVPKTLKKTAIPSIFPWAVVKEENFHLKVKLQKLSHSFIPPVHTYARIPPIAFVEEHNYSNSMICNMDEDPLAIETEEGNHNYYETFPQLDPGDNVAEEITIQSQNEFVFENQLLDNIEFNNKSVQTDNDNNLVSTFNIYNYKKKDKIIHFYTGLENFDKLMLVFTTLGPEAHELNYFYGNHPQELDTLNMFFITLIILRRHNPFEEVAMMFEVTVKQIYNIFTTWIRFMSLQWKNLDLWVDRETVQAYMPIDFQDQFPSTRLILDATECPVKKPKLPLAQQATFSSYKNRNTVKFLIGITPGGLISYVSPCYGGSATDRQILERSSILDRFNPNDEIMVDKGFNVQDIFLPLSVKVNMPSFFKKGNQIQAETLASNRKISSKRVHVERVIGLLKTYKILTQPMNQTEIKLSSDIVFVCSMLVNFRSNIMHIQSQL